jgi:uncharacterized membrane protein YbhN (UPF0104 family)
MMADRRVVAVVQSVEMMALPATIGDTVRAFVQAAGQFFDNLAQLRFESLGIALACFAAYLLLRSRATFNALRAAYPDSRFPWRRIWGAYVAAYGLNGIVPAGGGSIVQLVLTKKSIERSTYSTVASALCVPGVFDTLMCAVLLGYAFTQGVFPKPRDFGGLESFDIAFFGRHPEVTLFIVTALVVVGLAIFALLSRRIVTFWSQLRRGFAIMRQGRRYLLGMCVPQLGAWILRGATYYFLLDAFHVGASVRSAILVLAVQVIAAIVPFTPGGAGVQQALLVVIFASTSSTDSVATFSVGQQIALVACALALGFGAIFFIFRYRSFRAVLRDSRAAHADELASERLAESTAADREAAPL